MGLDDLHALAERGWGRVGDVEDGWRGVIELISPTNTRRAGFEVYRENRADLLAAGVNLVEVDLLRQGDWQALLRLHLCPREARSTYRVTIRTPPGAAAGLFALALRERLRDIRVSLREQDLRVFLPLQRLIESSMRTAATT